MNEENENSVSDDQEEGGQKVIKTRQLTVLEQRYFDEARQRHKENNIRKNIVQGKEYTNTPFISKPAVIDFKDFDVGVPMTITIYLTNVSFAFNSFKVLPLNESIKDFFQVTYTPAGRISAGMSTPIHFRFMPEVNQDINDYFQILAETGPVNIPLVCTYKKSIVKSESQIIDFGKVIFGESCTRLLKLTNQGALETDIIMRGKGGKDLFGIGASSKSSHYGKAAPVEETKSQEEQFFEALILQIDFLKFSKIGGYTSHNLSFTFKPTEIGIFSLNLQICFENFKHSPPIDISLVGECIDVPIYVEKPLYDFQTCLMERSYREKIVFYNRGTTAMKVQIVSLNECKKFFEFNPVLGYIQAKSTFDVWVKFIAKKEVLQMCQKYISGDCLEIPFKLEASDQIMPVNFTIKANLTNDDFVITPRKIDFGKIFENQASKVTLLFQNNTALPASLIFYPLPKGIFIDPDMIPIVIKPNEQYNISFIFKGSEVQSINAKLHFKILFGEIYTKNMTINYQCEVVKSHLKMSQTKIDLPVLPIQEQFNTTIDLKNCSQRQIKFEFFLPPYEICGLKINPMVMDLNPDQSTQVDIEYKSFFKKLTPSLIRKFENNGKEQEIQVQEIQQNVTEQAGAKDNKKGAKKMSKQEEEEEALKKQQEQERLRQEALEEERRKQEEEENFDPSQALQQYGGRFYEFNPETQDKNQHYTWLVPCNFKYLEAPDSTTQQTYIEINTVSVTKTLELDMYQVDFGEIAVGFQKNQNIIISNNSQLPVELHMDQLPLFGGFSVVNALRTLNPGQKKQLIIKFEPIDEQNFKQVLRISCETNEVSVQLFGKGVKPEVKLSQQDGLFNMGGVMLGERVSKSFTIENISKFPNTFKLVSQGFGIGNSKGSQPFTFIPAEATIAAKSLLEVTVQFQPDRVSESFFQLITIDIPNQKDEKSILIYGKCYPRQAYLSYYKPYEVLPKPEQLQKNIEYPFDTISKSDELNIFSASNKRVLLEFKKIVQNDPDSQNKQSYCFLKKILCGNCKLMDSKNEKPANYEIIMPTQPYFICDIPKGTAAAGQESIISFTFNPPQVDPFIANVEVLKGIGQWIEQKVELKLTGGYLQPGAVDQISFEIILRAYINQI